MSQIVGLFLSVFIAFTSYAQGNYDEVFGPDGIRPQYESAWKVYSRLSDQKKKNFERYSSWDFRGDNALLPLPRVLTNPDATLLKNGVEQRGRALHAFLKDYYSGRKTYLKTNVIPEFIVKGAISRSKEIVVEDLGSDPQFHFWYGPDVIRDPQGQFRVVEDNLGFIGGMGDLTKARQSLVRNVPAYKPLVKETVKPESFYENIAQRYHELAQAKGGIPLLITYRPSTSADNEDERIRQIFKKLGIESHVTNGVNDGRASKLEMRSDGLYLTRISKAKESSSVKVGHVILDYEAHDFDTGDVNNRAKLLEELAKEVEDTPGISASLLNRIKKIAAGDSAVFESWIRANHAKYWNSDPLQPTGYEGFWKLAREGKVSVTNGWGAEFVNDKGFYPYVENLIRFYLNEEPILKNIETESAAIFDSKGIHLNPAALKRMESNPNDYVTKGVTGRGGDAVWIGKKMSADQLKKVVDLVKSNPQYYIFQKYTPLSTMDGYIVDLRSLSDISEKGALGSSVPWGRGVPIDSDGKVNLAQQGRETVFLVQNASCNELLSGDLP